MKERNAWFFIYPGYIWEIYLRWTLISWEYNGSNQTHGCYWRSRAAAVWSACIIIILSLSSPSQLPTVYTTQDGCVLVLIEETNVRVNVFSHLSLTCFARTHQAGVLLFYNFIIPSHSAETRILQKLLTRSNCEDCEITTKQLQQNCFSFSDFSKATQVDFKLNLLFHPVTINVAQQMCSCMPVEYLCRYNVTWQREWLVLHFYF